MAMPSKSVQIRYDRIVGVLVLSGLIGAFGAAVILAEVVGGTPEEGIIEPRHKPIPYYALHTIGIAAVITAGVLAGLTGEYRRLGRPTRLAFWVLQFTSIAWAFCSYNIDDVISWKALGATGPLVWLTSVLIFAGMKRSIWNRLEPTIHLLSYILAVLALYAMASADVYITDRWNSKYVQYMVLLMWFGGWTFLTGTYSRGWRMYLRYFPYIVFVLSSIYTQTRSWLLMSVLLLPTLLLVTRRTPQYSTVIVRRLAMGLLVLAVMGISVILLFGRHLPEAATVFMERLNEDTRTRQYIEFFWDVSPSELILGRGPTGTWDWQGKDYQWIDNSYLFIAFIGGLPTLLSYLVLVILPGIRAYFRGTQQGDAAAAALLILWGLACAGVSTYSLPSLTAFHYLLYLMAGRCLGYLSEVRRKVT